MAAIVPLSTLAHRSEFQAERPTQGVQWFSLPQIAALVAIAIAAWGLVLAPLFFLH